MLRLLWDVQPGMSIPMPSQLLALLPVEGEYDWPRGFQFEAYTDLLEDEDNLPVVPSIHSGGRHSSPFVRLSKAYPDYPLYRRASRLSYTVWLLIQPVAFKEGSGLDKQMILERTKIEDRLQMAIQQLQAINAELRPHALFGDFLDDDDDDNDDDDGEKYY